MSRYALRGRTTRSKVAVCALAIVAVPLAFTTLHATATTANGGSCAANNKFGRMFPSLPAADFPVADLQKLGTQIVESSHMASLPGTSASPDEMDITAGYTYAGQFMDHDITLDPRPNDLISMVNPSTLVNNRTPQLDLDSVYGSGPKGSPQLFESDGIHLKLGAHLGGSSFDPDAHDVLRDANGQAVLGDGRNDENRIVGSLHSIFTRFHNEQANKLQSKNPSWSASQVYEAARQQTVWYYQWAILTDFLPTMSSSSDVAKVASYSGGRWNTSLAFYDTCNGSMPLEFSTAAYRWHTMVRNDYQINNEVKDKEIFNGSFDPSENLAGFQPAPSNFGEDWDRFFKMTEQSPMEAYKLDNSLVPALGKLPPDAAGAGPVNLATRNLLRGRQLSLPSGQDVARAMGVSPLRDDQIIIGPALGKGAPTKALTEVSSSFTGKAPLWTYLFAESVNQAFTVSGGRIVSGDTHHMQLGPVTARIVNETFVGLMAKDPNSVINHPEFTPDASLRASDGSFKLRDIIRIGTGAPSFHPSRGILGKDGTKAYLDSSGRTHVAGSSLDGRWATKDIAYLDKNNWAWLGTNNSVIQMVNGSMSYPVNFFGQFFFNGKSILYSATGALQVVKNDGGLWQYNGRPNSWSYLGVAPKVVQPTPVASPLAPKACFLFVLCF